MGPNHTGEWSQNVRFEIANSKGLQLAGATSLAAGVPLAAVSAALIGPPTIKSPVQGAVITASTFTVQVVLPQGAGTTAANLWFERNTQPLQNAPLWQKVTIIDAYNTAKHPNGLPLTVGQFPATGQWRVKAQVQSPGAPWSGFTSFEIKPLTAPTNLQLRRQFKGIGQ